ncbi:MAG: hypothetical protein JXB23_06055, partial [Candidatus Aminicenantes bacterium]|nr:hypothetical protein [Candidatus Aminicenantes bacterium]
MNGHKPKTRNFLWRAIKHPLVCTVCLLLLTAAIPACKKRSKEEIKTAAEPRAQEVIETKEQEPPAKSEAKQLQIFVIPKDGGFTRSLEKPISITFSQPVESKDLKFRISPDPGGWSTAWEEGGKQV